MTKRSETKRSETKRSEQDIDEMLATVAADYADEDRAAAADEAREAAASRVFSVRLPDRTYRAVRDAAAAAHLTPSALIRQWVSERAEQPADSDVGDTIAALRRDIERLAQLTATR